jgi:hypothetical protein
MSDYEAKTAIRESQSRNLASNKTLHIANERYRALEYHLHVEQKRAMRTL